MSRFDFDPEGKRLPIKIDGTSNGEFEPFELSPLQKIINTEAHKKATELSRQLGWSRREFLKSACGAAATLLTINEIYRHLGRAGGFFHLPEPAAKEKGLAQQHLVGAYRVIDMQTHCVEPTGNWAKGKDGKLWIRNLTEVFGQAPKCGGKKGRDRFFCYSAEQLVKEVFLDSDTDMAVVSSLWGAKGNNPTPTHYADEVRDIVGALGDRNRALIHGGVLPNEPGAIDFMDVQVEKYKVDAWKLYPQWRHEANSEKKSML